MQLLCNTPGTADGPGGRDRTLAIKSRKTGSIWQIGPGSIWQIGPGSIWQIGPGSMWQIGPGSMWQIGPGLMWQIGPGSMWQIKAKDGEKKRRQAGAELCQAQDKLSLVMLNFYFIWTE